MPNGKRPIPYGPSPPPPPSDPPAPPRPPPSDLQGLKELFERMQSRLEGMPPPPPPTDYGPYYTPPPPVPPTVPDQGEWAEGMWEWYQATQLQRDAAYARERLSQLRPGPMTRMGEPPEGWPFLPDPRSALQSAAPSPSLGERVVDWRRRNIPSLWTQYAATEGTPRSFWEWFEAEGQKIDPSWMREARTAVPTVWPGVTRFGAGGFHFQPGERFIPQAARKYVPNPLVLYEPEWREGWEHELAHRMDFQMGRPADSPEWREAVVRWRKDEDYPSGEEIWGRAMKRKPGTNAWRETYAYAAEVPLETLPPYIREFLPWRYGALATMPSPEDLEAARLRMTPIGPQW